MRKTLEEELRDFLTQQMVKDMNDNRSLAPNDDSTSLALAAVAKARWDGRREILVALSDILCGDR